METVTIGIDLGTTNTLACYMKKGKPTLFKFDGEKMLPSMLYVETDGSLTIGHEARVKGEGDPDNLIRSSKTFMGDSEKNGRSGENLSIQLMWLPKFCVR